MAHDKEIRFRCRALFEVMNMTLSDVAKQENVGISTLSDWKNDDREEYGGIWLQGCKAGKIEQTATKLREELRATSVYDEMKNNLNQYYGITKQGDLQVDGILDISSDNAQLQARIETDITLLASVQADWFDSQLFKNSMLSSIVLSNQVKKDITKVKQSDIKASSEIHKIAKESRFGKSPDTVVFNVNGDYSAEELNELSVEQLQQLMNKENQKMLEGKVKEKTVS
jgi:transcriptional regulator with XRE-family HTH domain